MAMQILYAILGLISILSIAYLWNRFVYGKILNSIDLEEITQNIQTSPISLAIVMKFLIGLKEKDPTVQFTIEKFTNPPGFHEMNLRDEKQQSFILRVKKTWDFKNPEKNIASLVFPLRYELKHEQYYINPYLQFRDFSEISWFLSQILREESIEEISKSLVVKDTTRPELKNYIITEDYIHI